MIFEDEAPAQDREFWSDREATEEQAPSRHSYFRDSGPVWQLPPEVGKAYAQLPSMTGTTRKFQRSGFFRSLNIVWPTNHLRTARMDFWGAVALVCAIGIFAKFVQNLLTN